MLALQQSASLSRSNQTFLRELRIDHGPIATLGRFFLAAVSELQANGISLEVVTPTRLVEANQQNAGNWLPLVQVFHPAWSDVDETNQISLIGRKDGQVVLAHAMRLFDWTSSNFHDEIASFRLLYRDPENQKLPGETVTITANAAKAIGGRVAFSGAAWCHPDMRGRGLSHVMPRIGKALALARWNIERVVAIMNEGVHGKGFAPRFGYHGIDWGVRYQNCRCGIQYVAVLWMERENLEAYIEDYLRLGASSERFFDGADEDGLGRRFA